MPQILPLALVSAFNESVQVEVPVLQEVVPRSQIFAGVQARLAVQATQAPTEQTKFGAQVVPLATAVPVSVQVKVPVLQEAVPMWQLFVGVQAPPAVQETQAPAEQTRFVPQVVPSVAFPLSVQTCAPVAQEKVAVWQGFVEVQVPPAVQATHAPFEQTWFAPQVVPSARFPVSVQTGAPLAQEMAAA